MVALQSLDLQVLISSSGVLNSGWNERVYGYKIGHHKQANGKKKKSVTHTTVLTLF